jgi:MFS family permease
MSLDQPLSGSSEVSAEAIGAPAIPRRSFWGLLSISIFWLALNFHWAAIIVIILPSQVEALLAHSYLQSHAFNQDALNTFINNNKAVALALVSTPGLLVALFSNPLFGMLSDRTFGRWGRRRPYIAGGALLNIAGLLLMAVAPNIITLLLALCLVQFANNAAAAPFHAYLPDLVNEEQRGLASGLMGLAQSVGIILGAEVVGQLVHINAVQDATSAASVQSALSGYSGELLAAYGAIAAFMLLLMLLTIWTVKEPAWPRQALSADRAPAGGFNRRGWLTSYRRQIGEGALALALVIVVLVGSLLVLQTFGLRFDLDGAHLPQSGTPQAASDAAQHANIAINGVLLVVMLIVTIWAARLFDFRPRRDPDFAWVAGTRLLVTLGVQTVEVFLQYYFHDVLGRTDQEAQAGLFAAVLTVAAALTTFFGGWYSTRIGRKRMVYFCGAVMTAVAAIFIPLNFFAISGAVDSNTGVTIALVAGAIFGLGYGAYLSVDWALVADVLPSKERFARDMGIWNIAVTIPQVIAFVIGSILLSLTVPTSIRYTLLFVTFAVYSIAGTVTVRYIKGVKR